MTISIIITICLLLLLAYVFEISSGLTRIPSVILLLLLGCIVRQFVEALEFQIIDLKPVLPILGTIGLVLIVLEGTLELELNQSKIPVIKKSLFNALVPIILLSFIIAFLFRYFGNVSFKIALLNAIPFCIISSAIAIPSVKNLSTYNKEFVIYESSLSDIIGIMVFNFITMNELINADSFINFTLEVLFIIVLSFIAVLGLSFLLSRIEHHITYMPIILMVILLYSVSKNYHLPGLIFIIVFGLFLGNLDELRQFKWIEKFRPDKLDKEVAKFKELTIEFTFLIRSLFFLLFGYLIEVNEILNISTLFWAAGIVLIIIGIRWIFLKISGLHTSTLLYIAPRGLITILLFLSILPDQSISLVNKSLVIQTIVFSVIIMMIGLILNKSKETEINIQ